LNFNSFYDRENKGALLVAQASELVSDLDPKLKGNKAKERAQRLINSFGSNDCLNLADFSDALRSDDGFIKAGQLLRLQKSYFDVKRGKSSGSSGSSNGNSDSKTTPSSARPKSRGSDQEGTCFAHSDKKYEYGLHTVQWDSTGRCIDPRIINERKLAQCLCTICHNLLTTLSLSCRLGHTMGRTANDTKPILRRECVQRLIGGQHIR